MLSSRFSKESRRGNDVKASLFVLPFLVLNFATSVVNSQPITQYAGNDTTIEGRWKWAYGQGSRLGNHQSFWIGYGIKRLMDADSYVLSGRVSSRTLDRGKSLYALITRDTSRQVRSAIERWSGGRVGILKRMKDIALLFLVERNPSGFLEAGKLSECTMDLGFDLGDRPLFWLGTADDNESVRRLRNLYDATSSLDFKKDLVRAAGVHQPSSDVFHFLTGVLKAAESDVVRAQAAFWIGEQDNPEALKILLNAAEKDSSLKVREQAVFAISRLDTNESTDALISLARTANSPKIRGKATFWLGQKASQKAVATLEDIIANNEETEVQRQALFALSQMKGTEGVERLIRIARTHPNPRIRKLAIQLLGQSDDPKALDALIAIVRK